jgi:PAS domain S-box-containing protein
VNSANFDSFAKMTVRGIPTSKRKHLLRAVAAIFAVLAALLITSQIEPLASRTPFALFFPSVAFAAWIGGRLIGFTALVLSVVVSGYSIVPLTPGIRPDLTWTFQLATFVLVGFLLVLLASRWNEDRRTFIEGEARYRTLFEYSPYGILIADEKSNYIDANDKMCQMLGYTHRELTGMNASDIVAPQEMPHVDDALHTLRTGDDHSREWLFRRKDESQFVGEVVATEMPDGTLLGVVRDVTEREHAEHRFRQLIEGAPNGMVMVDESGKIQLVNAEIEKLFGYRRDELFGQSIDMLVPDRFRNHHDQYRKAFVASPIARPMGSGRDLFGLRKDGSEFPVEIGLNPIQTEKGIVVLGTIVDITERKRAEESLRQSQEGLKAVFDTALDGIIMMDHTGTIVGFNPSAERIFDYRGSDVIGQKLANKIIPAGMHEAHRRGLERLLSSGEGPSLGKRLEMTALRSDGTEFPVELAISRVGSADPPLFTGFVRDITERKRVEETLRRSQEQLAGIIDSAMDAIITVDDEQKVVLFNSAAEKMFRYPPDQALGKPLDRFIPERFRNAHKDHIQNFGKTSVTRRSMASLGAIFGIRSDGDEFPIEASISQLESEGRKYFTVILRDITERKAAEERNLQLHETLERRVAERTSEWELANKELEAFSYSVSHDLRAPLRHIDGFVKLLASREAEHLDSTSQRYLTVVTDAVGKMGLLIDELLAFSRTSRQEIRMSRVDLNPLLRESLQMLEPMTAGRSIEWKIEPLPDVRGDPTLLGLVFSNLLSNAVKFTRNCETASIEVGSLEEKNGKATIYIKDNGVGFDMAYSKKLFGVFQRLHRDDEFEGIGIGLATVQRIISRHGGRIWADAEVDKGATFYFALKKAN